MKRVVKGGRDAKQGRSWKEKVAVGWPTQGSGRGQKKGVLGKKKGKGTEKGPSGGGDRQDQYNGREHPALKKKGETGAWGTK